jgi:four helix bundle protein
MPVGAMDLGGSQATGNRMGPLFDHERLEVYQLARQFNRSVRELLDLLPRGHAESRDNLRRAAKSVTRNLAEGCGKWKLPDKINFYQIARASATECAACLDELVDFAMVPESAVTPAKQTLARVIAMLVAMIRSLESRMSDNAR